MSKIFLFIQAVLQAVELVAPPLLSIVNTALSGIFGQFNDLAMTVSVGDLAFYGVKLCVNPGVISTVACAVIRQLAADVDNIQEVDGALEFSLLGYVSFICLLIKKMSFGPFPTSMKHSYLDNEN